MARTSECRICSGLVTEFIDLGRQPLADAFRLPQSPEPEFFYRLAVGTCADCQMAQLMEEVPRERMFHEDYPYLSSGSTVMRAHFEGIATRLLETEMSSDDPFVVEIGSNDGVLLKTVAAAGVRHLGVEPSGGVADLAAAEGVSVRKDFFEESVAREILAEHGHADVIFSANTFSHIPYVDSVLRGIKALLGPDGVFVFEDPYFGDIVERTSFDQIYDEHFFFFTARSVARMAELSGMELVDVEHLPTHGGEIRYTLAHAGAREASEAVKLLMVEEERRELTSPATLARFVENVERVRTDLLAELRRIKERGERVVGYGATAKSATVLNFCGIGPDLVEFICDSTPAKQGRLTPGTHIPVRGPEEYRRAYPDYALLLAWNHAEEIMAKETEFQKAGGRWIRYVPEVSVS
ncbi:class I SAM-dependent methyltransferase [Nocardiopsis alba]|uniref:Methyltransferase domain-containing protein n=1 Tax=Nocardiopsis alba TaxID=53437 RepID=A0A7K2IR42_9ACTN|nr:class I SAM-dependent methyltransferase [Nocardiopsis alba]MYR32438.1 methyltransferase domain-containing protein [Nocardiopsis alba]